MSENEESALEGLKNANRTVNEFSSYRGALGATGTQDAASNAGNAAFLGNPGDSAAVNPSAAGFGDIYIGCAWNAVKKPATNPVLKLLKLAKTQSIDLDLGCMYEMQDGDKGALQALGAASGAYDTAPFMTLSHDERTGVADGDDEFLRINGARWSDIKRVLIYAYIYEGAPDWSYVRPEIVVRVAGKPDFHVRPRVASQHLGVCAIAMLEQVRGGLKLTNLTEFFPGQPEMDRAYGFGLNWDDGEKE